MSTNERDLIVGGQAVIEGVMMRTPNAYAIAVRKADGTIDCFRSDLPGTSVHRTAAAPDKCDFCRGGLGQYTGCFVNNAGRNAGEPRLVGTGCGRARLGAPANLELSSRLLASGAPNGGFQFDRRSDPNDVLSDHDRQLLSNKGYTPRL